MLRGADGLVVEEVALVAPVPGGHEAVRREDEGAEERRLQSSEVTGKAPSSLVV